MKSAVATGLDNIFAQNNIIAQVYNKTKDLVYKFQRDKQSQIIIGSILFINLFFISLHFFIRVLIYYDLFDNLVMKLHLNSWRLRLDSDWSFPELFNYLQTTMCVVLLLGVFRATRQPLYVAWVLIFLFVALDDSLIIHERLASYIVGAFGVPALLGLRPQDSGELLVWAMVGSTLLGILWWGFARSGRDARAAGGVLAVALGALIFFAMGIDMAHVAFSGTNAVVSALLAILEDGGEMLSIGLACALALLLYRHPSIAG